MKFTNLNLYRSFLMVYETGSMSAAAKQLSLTQPTITHNIRELEKALRAILFAPHSRGVTPTKNAETLYKHIRPAFTEIQKAEQHIKKD